MARSWAVNDAYVPPSAGAVSLGFAIPAATALDIVEQLLADGRVSVPFIGIQPARLFADIARQLGLELVRDGQQQQVQVTFAEVER